MQTVAVTILRFVDDYQPGIVECELVDAHGQSHTFIGKAPYFSSLNLWWDSEYPLQGNAECKVIGHLQEAAGRDLVQIMTSEDSTDGQSQFTVLETQLSIE